MGQNSMSTRGFTLIELLIVLLVLGTLFGISMMVLPGMIMAAKADSGSTQITALLRAVRERSITERRNIEIRFIAPNRVEAWRDDINENGLPVDQTLVQESIVEQGMEFERFVTVPDTPDGFAAGGNALEFTGAAPWRFSTEGTLVDANGDVVNGTVFLGQPRRPEAGWSRSRREPGRRRPRRLRHRWRRPQLPAVHRAVEWSCIELSRIDHQLLHQPSGRGHLQVLRQRVRAAQPRVQLRHRVPRSIAAAARDADVP